MSDAKPIEPMTPEGLEEFIRDWQIDGECGWRIDRLIATIRNLQAKLAEDEDCLGMIVEQVAAICGEQPGAAMFVPEQVKRLKAKLTAAVADNAALLAYRCWCCDDGQSHPGSALLAELQKLRAEAAANPAYCSFCGQPVDRGNVRHDGMTWCGCPEGGAK